jgi:predicted DNA-binding transcriptional regulator AlpA
MAADTPQREAPLPELLSAPGLADYLSVPVSTVYHWRNRGEGPPGFKVGKRVYYRADEVAKWLGQQAAER